MSLIIVSSDNTFASMVGDSGHWNDDGSLAHLAPKMSANRGGTLFGWCGRGGWENAEVFWNAAGDCKEMTPDEGKNNLQKWAAEISARLYARAKVEVQGQGILAGRTRGGVWIRTVQYIYDPSNRLMISPLLCKHFAIFPDKLTLVAVGRDSIFKAEQAHPNLNLKEFEPASRAWLTAISIMQKSVEGGEQVAGPFHTLTI